MSLEMNNDQEMNNDLFDQEMLRDDPVEEQNNKIKAPIFRFQFTE